MMTVPENLASDVLVKSGRRCCICRRFKPLQLQVHHIKPLSEGGTDEPDNLIAVCLTCHSDVHSEPGFGRRFAHEELKRHRDEVFRLVGEGKLAEPHETLEVNALIEDLVGRLTVSLQAKHVEADLPPESVDLLLRAVRDNGLIYNVSETLHWGTNEDARKGAKLRFALEHLEEAGLAQYLSGMAYCVTHEGFLLADALLAAEAEEHDEA